MTDPSSKTGALGLSSVLQPDASGDSASGVAAMASRFNAAHKEADSPKMSDKVSSIANRFGATVHDEPAGKYTPAPSLRRPTSVGNAPKTGGTARQPFLNHVDEEEEAERKKRQQQEDIIQESAGSVGNVAKIFDTGSTTAPLNKGEENSGENGASVASNFLSAKNLFKKAEENTSDKQESKVSSFAKLIDTNATTARNPVDIPADNAIAGVAKQFETTKNGTANKPGLQQQVTQVETAINAGIGDVVSKFENIKKEEESGDNQKEKEESLESRFANAAKLFESGSANTSNAQEPPKFSAMASKNTSEPEPEPTPKPQQEAPQEKEEKAEEEEVSSVQSRFADAARMFGGSS